MRLQLPFLLPGTLAATFDYVIVGGGTSGLLLANRLSENPSTSVAVIDPGPDQRDHEAIEDPAQWMTLANTTLGANWGYESVPQVHAHNRTIVFSAGKGLGGSSLINGS